MNTKDSFEFTTSVSRHFTFTRSVRGTELIVAHEVTADGEGAGGQQLVVAGKAKFGVTAEAQPGGNNGLIKATSFFEL